MTRRSKAQSGSHQLLKVDGTCYRLNHYIDVVGLDAARLVAEHLHGFDTSIDRSPFDNGIGPACYQVRVSDTYIPDNQMTPEMAVARGRRVIARVLEQVPGARIVGFDRQVIPPERRHHHDGDDGDSPVGLPLPLRS